MPLEYVSDRLGVLAIALGFAPYLPIQILGVCAGIAGIIASRRAVKRDYRRDLPLKRWVWSHSIGSASW